MQIQFKKCILKIYNILRINCINLKPCISVPVSIYLSLSTTISAGVNVQKASDHVKTIWALVVVTKLLILVTPFLLPNRNVQACCRREYCLSGRSYCSLEFVGSWYFIGYHKALHYDAWIIFYWGKASGIIWQVRYVNYINITEQNQFLSDFYVWHLCTVILE